MTAPAAEVPFVAVEQDEAGRGDVQGEPEKGRHQEKGGKGREFQGMREIEGGQTESPGRR